jgi:lipopolysaccharide biosynthesis glycosyltransferase
MTSVLLSVSFPNNNIYSNLANFVRFVISDLLPNQHKAMWVDADTVIECDVVSMVRNALTKTSHAIAAVPIDRKPMGIASKVLKSRSRELSISFNAGVFVVDLDRWRSRELTKQVRKLTLRNRKEQIYAYGSQPPLVLTIGDKFEHMSPAWNVKVNKLNHGHFNGNACLWHWSGKRKPWNTSNDPDIHNELWQRYATGNTDKMQEFQPTNLVLAERVPCGACKCFYQLKSDSQAGYLVAPSSTPRILKNMGSEENWFDALEKGWYYAEHLRRKYKITHLLLSPPTNMTVSKELATYLNSNLWNVGHDEEYDGRYDEGNMECYKEGSTVSLQRVAKAPQPNLLLGIQYHKYEAFKYELNQFLAPIKNKESFARRFSQGIADTRKLLRKEPCLVSDFQLLLDKKGNIYHLDFERCFRSDARDEAELCFKALDEAEQLVYQAVSQQP